MYLGNMTADLLGKHGPLKQLRAYSYLRKDPPHYLVRYLRCCDDAIDAIGDNLARQIIIGMYKRGLSVRDLQRETALSASWIHTAHAVGVSEFGEQIDLALGNYLPTLIGEAPIVGDPADGVKEW